MAESRRDFRVECDILSLERLPRHVDDRAAEDLVYDLQNRIAISRGLPECIGASHSRQSPIIRTANAAPSQRTCAIHPHKHQPPRQGRGPSHYATCADPKTTTPSSSAQISINARSTPSLILQPHINFPSRIMVHCWVHFTHRPDRLWLTSILHPATSAPHHWIPPVNTGSQAQKPGLAHNNSSRSLCSRDRWHSRF